MDRLAWRIRRDQTKHPVGGGVPASSGHSAHHGTGDNESTAKAVGNELGIDEIHAGLSPENKIDLVKRLKTEGHVVAIAGYGINDAPAVTLVKEISTESPTRSKWGARFLIAKADFHFQTGVTRLPIGVIAKSQNMNPGTLCIRG